VHSQSGMLVHAPAVAKGDSVANERACRQKDQHVTNLQRCWRNRDRDIYKNTAQLCICQSKWHLISSSWRNCPRIYTIWRLRHDFKAYFM